MNQVKTIKVMLLLLSIVLQSIIIDTATDGGSDNEYSISLEFMVREGLNWTDKLLDPSSEEYKDEKEIFEKWTTDLCLNVYKSNISNYKVNFEEMEVETQKSSQVKVLESFNLVVQKEMTDDEFKTQFESSLSTDKSDGEYILEKINFKSTKVGQQPTTTKDDTKIDGDDSSETNSKGDSSTTAASDNETKVITSDGQEISSRSSISTTKEKLKNETKSTEVTTEKISHSTEEQTQATTISDGNEYSISLDLMVKDGLDWTDDLKNPSSQEYKDQKDIFEKWTTDVCFDLYKSHISNYKVEFEELIIRPQKSNHPRMRRGTDGIQNADPKNSGSSSHVKVLESFNLVVQEEMTDDEFKTQFESSLSANKSDGDYILETMNLKSIKIGHQSTTIKEDTKTDGDDSSETNSKGDSSTTAASNEDTTVMTSDGHEISSRSSISTTKEKLKNETKSTEVTTEKISHSTEEQTQATTIIEDNEYSISIDLMVREGLNWTEELKNQSSEEYKDQKEIFEKWTTDLCLNVYKSNISNYKVEFKELIVGPQKSSHPRIRREIGNIQQANSASASYVRVLESFNLVVHKDMTDDDFKTQFNNSLSIKKDGGEYIIEITSLKSSKVKDQLTSTTTEKGVGKNDENDSTDKKLPGWAIALIVIASIVFVGVVIFIIFKKKYASDNVTISRLELKQTAVPIYNE